MTLIFPDGAVLIAVDCSALRVVVVEEYLVISLVRSGALNRDTVVVSLLGVLDGAAIGSCLLDCQFLTGGKLGECLVNIVDDAILLLSEG